MHVGGDASAGSVAAKAADADSVGVGGGTEVCGVNQVSINVSKVRLEMTERVVWTELGDGVVCDVEFRGAHVGAPLSRSAAVRANMHVVAGELACMPPSLVGSPNWSNCALAGVSLRKPMMWRRACTAASCTSPACGSTWPHGITRES